jgi:hypothetical protein
MSWIGPPWIKSKTISILSKEARVCIQIHWQHFVALPLLKTRLCPKVTGMMYNSKVQGNVFALVQIFNAIPSPPFSAPAELRTFIPHL